MREGYATVWEAIADATPDADALVQGDRRVTWGELDDRAARLASAFSSLGVGPGTRVALLLHNSPEFAESIAACLKLRALPVGVNPRYQRAEVAHLVTESRAPLLLHHSSLAESADVAVRARVVVDDATAGREHGGAGADRAADGRDELPDYEDLIAAAEPAARTIRSGTDPLLWYTGGTTGAPKGVVWEQATLLSFQVAYGAALLGTDAPGTIDELARAAAQRAAVGTQLVSLVTSSLAHATATNQLHLALAHGGTLVMLPPGRVDGDEICRTVEGERVRLLSVVGEVVLRRIVDALDRAADAGDPFRLPSLRRMHNSGTTIRPETKAALHARLPGVELYDSLGATEAVGFAAARTRGSDPGTGRLRLGPNARVLDADDRDVAPGSGDAGVLAVAGSTAVGYADDAALTAATFREIDGVRHAVLGDWAVPHADGTITLLGRGSQCINTGGEKVWPEEVEELLAAHPAVLDATVVGIPDDEWGEVVAAVVALHPDVGEDAPGADELGEWVSARLARYKRPRRVVVVDEVQRTAVGKPDREWARTRFARPD